MFESRFQVGQLILFGAFGLALTGMLTLMFGPLVVGVVCLVLEHAVAAVGCAFYADAKGYSPLIGLPIGIGLGSMGAFVMVVLPDETKESPLEGHERPAPEALRNARDRDRGYEVL